MLQFQEKGETQKLTETRQMTDLERQNERKNNPNHKQKTQASGTTNAVYPAIFKAIYPDNSNTLKLPVWHFKFVKYRTKYC